MQTRAHELMLVNHVVAPEEVMSKAEEIAKKCGQCPSISWSYQGSIYAWSINGLGKSVAFAQTKRDLILHTADAAEGVKAFAEKELRDGQVNR
ncbi:MAG: hypothetical protein Ct9H300mP27_10970 [Chloroflexota bacterium]|nr:MAG: hypothetical protein Ct9H300mP27_10970 [Chloroflexota bacterium]